MIVRVEGTRSFEANASGEPTDSAARSAPPAGQSRSSASQPRGGSAGTARRALDPRSRRISAEVLDDLATHEAWTSAFPIEGEDAAADEEARWLRACGLDVE